MNMRSARLVARAALGAMLLLGGTAPGSDAPPAREAGAPERRSFELRYDADRDRLDLAVRDASFVVLLEELARQAGIGLLVHGDHHGRITARFTGVPLEEGLRRLLEGRSFAIAGAGDPRDPLVLGLGFAATRDLVAFLRHEAFDDHGNPNPVAGLVDTTLVHGTSQSGRFLRGYLQLGFNEDESGRIVFDGANPHIASGRIPLNVRFGQPGRAYGEREDHLFPVFEGPLTTQPARDPHARTTAGLLDRCRRTNTCPRIMHTVSSTEYWQGRASLNATDALARHDLGLPGHVRKYLFASTQHFALPLQPGQPLPSVPPAGCEQPTNPNSFVPPMRALLVGLEEWVRDGRQPPKSRIPTLRGRTLATSDQAALGFPSIPGVLYNGTFNRMTLLDFGPDFDPVDLSGILIEPPAVVAGADYAVRLPTVDADGNEIAGIRSPDVQAPVGTLTGWNIRTATGELCGLSGGFVPFASTEVERLAAGDPRASLEARYGSHAGYVEAVRAAAEQLVSERLLLPADAERYVERAAASDILQ